MEMTEMTDDRHETKNLLPPSTSDVTEESPQPADPAPRDAGETDSQNDNAAIGFLRSLMEQRSEAEVDLPDRTDSQWHELIPGIVVSGDMSNIKDNAKPALQEAHELFKLTQLSHERAGGDEVDSGQPVVAFGDIAIPVSLMAGGTCCQSADRKYLHLPRSFEPKDICKCLTDTWNLPRPQILISLITGKGMDPELLKPLVSCIREVCADTKAWVITDGMHRGASRSVSKELQQDGNITLIGVSDWGELEGKEFLYGASVKNCNASYYFYSNESSLLQNEAEDMLNPYQDVYILANNADDHRMLVEHIRKSFALKYAEDACLPFLNIAISINENTKALEQIAWCVDEKFPVVLVSDKEPGKLETIFKKLERVKSRSAVVEPSLNEKEGQVLEEEIEDCSHEMKDLWRRILRCRHYLTLFESEFDTPAVMSAIFKGKKEIESVTSALVVGSLGLLKASLEREVDLVYDKDCCYMDRDTLERLYRMTLSDEQSLPSILYEDISNENTDEGGSANNKDTFAVVRYIFFLVVGCRYKLLFNPSEEFKKNSSNQVWHLMLYSVLADKTIDIVTYLASFSDCPLAALIFAHKLYQKLSERAASCLKRELKKKLSDNATECLNIAVKMLDAMHREDHVKAYQSLQRSLPLGLGRNVTVLSLAADSDAKSFIDRPCCGNVVEGVWTKGIKSTTWRNKVVGFVPVFGWLFLSGVVKRGTEHQASHSADGRQPPASQNKTFCKKLATFYSAPVTKFQLDLFSHLVFLFFFTQFMIFHLQPFLSLASVTYSEWLVYAFLAGKILDELRQMFCGTDGCLCDKGQSLDVLHDKVWPLCTRLFLKTRLYKIHLYLSEGTWNVLDVVMIVVSMASVVCRFTVSDVHFQIVRFLFAVSLLLFYTRSLRYLYIFEHIGPRVIAITLMLWELAYFSVILLVFHVSFGVAFQSLLAPGKPLSEHIVADIMYRTYWQMYGELFLDDAATEMGREVGPYGCEYMKEHGRPDLHCHSYFPFLLLAVYLFISNVLLLNALIALFGNTLNTVEQNRDVHWAFEKYRMTREYYCKFLLPPPLNVLAHPAYLLWSEVRRCCKPSQSGSDEPFMMTSDHWTKLIQFEKRRASELLLRKTSVPTV